jgi:hypothetical protein
MRSLNVRQQEEIRSLASDELLTAESVVAFARDPSTALHSEFDWDDARAAHQERLRVARDCIVSVKIVTPEYNEPIQAFVSLKRDRKNEHGGYRDIVAVLSDAQMRQELLEQALREYRYWQKKYNHLVELAPIFEAAARVQRRRSRRQRERGERVRS